MIVGFAGFCSRDIDVIFHALGLTLSGVSRRCLLQSRAADVVSGPEWRRVVHSASWNHLQGDGQHGASEAARTGRRRALEVHQSAAVFEEGFLAQLYGDLLRP